MFDAAWVREDFGKAAGRYEQHALLQAQVRRQAMQLLQAHCGIKAAIIDIGGGTGALHNAALQAGLEWNITVIDAAHGMCKEARQKNLPAICADASFIPLTDNSTDYIFSSLMLQWIDRPVAVLAEAMRIIKPGGIAVFSTLVDGTLYELSDAFAAVSASQHVSDFFTANAICEAAEQAGGTLLEMRETHIVEYYPTLRYLMRQLKYIGATNKHRLRQRGLLTPRQLQACEAVYSKRYMTAQGLSATWNIMFIILQKPL